MKAIRIIYWISTSLVTLSLVMAGFMYFTSPEVAAGFTHLGFPDYFRVELGIAKLLAAPALIAPFTPRNVREWTYAGLGIVFISASLAHAASGDAGSNVASPLISYVLLSISYFTWNRIQRAKQAVN